MMRAWRFFVDRVSDLRIGYDSKRAASRTFTTADALYLFCICVAYSCAIFSRVFISAVAPAMNDDPNLDYDVSKHGSLLVYSGIAYGVSKLINGYLISLFDPRKMLVMYLSGSSAVVLLLSATNLWIPFSSKYAFLVCTALMNSFFQSGIWPACIKIFYMRFTPAQYGKALSCLGMASRLGSVFTSLTLGLVLQSLPWEDACRTAAAVTFGGGMLFVLGSFLMPFYVVSSESPAVVDECLAYETQKRTHDAPAPPSSFVKLFERNSSFRKNLRMYRGWWSNSSFVKMAAVNACLAILTTFEGFAALFASQVIQVEPALAAKLGATLPAGILFALVAGGLVIERYTTPSKATISIVLLFLNLLWISGLVVFSASVENQSHPCVGVGGTACVGFAGSLLFLYGASMGYPYYVDAQRFTIHFGGVHAAMVSSQFDTVSSALGAGFASLGSFLATSVGWTYVILMLLIAGFVAFFSLLSFHRESYATKRARRYLRGLKKEISNEDSEDSILKEFLLSNDDETPNETLEIAARLAIEERDERVERENLDKDAQNQDSIVLAKLTPSLIAANKSKTKQAEIVVAMAVVVFVVVLFGLYVYARNNPEFVFGFWTVVPYNGTNA